MPEVTPTKSGNPRTMCDRCDPPRPIMVKNFRTHMRKLHGVTAVGQRSFKRKPDPVRSERARRSAATRAANRAAAAPVVLVDKTAEEFTVLPNFRVLRDSNGGLWLAERMR